MPSIVWNRIVAGELDGMSYKEVYDLLRSDMDGVCILECKRCGHRWPQRGAEAPRSCANPRCRSPYWNKERRK